VQVAAAVALGEIANIPVAVPGAALLGGVLKLFDEEDERPASW